MFFVHALVLSAVPSLSLHLTQPLPKNSFHRHLVLRLCAKRTTNSVQRRRRRQRKTITYYLLYTHLLIRMSLHLPFRNLAHILPLLFLLPSHRVYCHCCWMKWYIICSHVCDCGCYKMIVSHAVWHSCQAENVYISGPFCFLLLLKIFLWNFYGILWGRQFRLSFGKKYYFKSNVLGSVPEAWELGGFWITWRPLESIWIWQLWCKHWSLIE